MDLTNINDLKSLLGKYHIRLTKKLGQHFLVDRLVLDQIIEAAKLTADDNVIEVGPGIGTLTKELAEKTKHVIAVEKDKRLIKPLRAALRDFSNVEIVNADFLSYQLPATTYKLIADIPYNITGSVIRKLTETSVRPLLMVLLVQREVGERITAKVGKMSILSVAVQIYFDPEIIRVVPPSSFFPEPKVESVIVRLSARSSPSIQVDQVKFFRLVRIGFSARRKTLLNNLSAGFKISKEEVAGILKQAGIAEKARAQELSLEDWSRLYSAIQAILIY